MEEMKNQTIVTDIENKNIECYDIMQNEDGTWHIKDKNGKIINTITKDNIVNYCKNELENNGTEYLNIDLMIDSIWWNVQDDYNLESVIDDFKNWDKFTAWFDYTIVEYLAQEIIAIYKQRLDDFE